MFRRRTKGELEAEKASDLQKELEIERKLNKLAQLEHQIKGYQSHPGLDATAKSLLFEL